MSLFRTRSTDAASLLIYALGPDSHVATVRNDHDDTVTVEINDPEWRCPEIVRQFFAAEGAMVDNARELLLVSRAVKKTVQIAIKTGAWRNENA